MVGAVGRHELPRVLEVTIPVGFARIACTDFDGLLSLHIHNAVDGRVGAAVSNAEHDGVLVGADDVGDVVEHMILLVDVVMMGSPPCVPHYTLGRWAFQFISALFWASCAMSLAM